MVLLRYFLRFWKPFWIWLLVRLVYLHLVWWFRTVEEVCRHVDGWCEIRACGMGSERWNLPFPFATRKESGNSMGLCVAFYKIIIT